jgi:hypothetical protein
MADRNFPTSADPGAYGDMLDKYAEIFGLVIPASVLPLTNVGGTANAITADVDPELPDSGLAAGMIFSITWAATSTSSGVTIEIGDESPVDLVTANGATPAVGQIESGRTDLLIHDGTNMRLITEGAVVDTGTASVEVFETSGTWTNDVPENTMVMVELWGAGADSVSNNGGAGGEYNRAFFKAGDLPASVAVGIGAPGGNDTTFGSYLTARGGQATPLGSWAGGAGGASGESGKAAYWGGGGGAGSTGGSGGTSEYGGAGGDPGNPGEVPGGGGGFNSDGARGEARITVF